MASQKDAKVTVGVEGAQEVARAADQALAPWERISKTVGGSFGKVRGAVGEAVQGIVSDLGHVVTVAGTISFASAAERVRAFEDATARMGVATGSNVEIIRARFERLAEETATKPEEIAAWTSQVGRLTYSYDGATKAVESMQEEALESGRTLGELAPLTVTLQTIGKASGDVGRALGVINAQAEAFRTIGGPTALKDQIVSLSDVTSHFAIQAEGDFARVTALIAGLGKGLAPVAAGRVQQQALSSVAADPLRWERYLGHSVTDEHGQVADPTRVLREIVEKTKRRYGTHARRVLELNFGAETGAAMFAADWGEIDRVGKVQPAPSKGALAAFKATDAGRRAVDAAKKDAAMRAAVGSESVVGHVANAVSHLAADHPIATAVGAQVGMGLVKTGARTLAGVLGGGGAAAGGGAAGAGAAAGQAAAGAGSGILGRVAGTLLGAPAQAAIWQATSIYDWAKASHELSVARPQIIAETAAPLAAQRANRARQLVTTWAESETIGEWKKKAPSELAQAAYDPALNAVARGLVEGQMDMKDLPADMAAAVAEALRGSQLQVTIINASGGPVEAVQDEKGSGAGAQ